MAYNPYINSFNTSGDFETYIESSAPKAPNVAYLKDLDQVRYTTILPNDYMVFGTTTGSTDFTGSGISFKVAEDPNGGDNILYVETSGVPQSLTSLNQCFNNTEGHKITKIKKWAIDTSNVTDMYRIFSSCSNLTSVDLSSFNTSNVTSMDGMFNICSNLTSLDLSSFNTSNVTSMHEMFRGCSNLTSLDLSSFDTSNVTDMDSMLQNCTKLNKLYLSSSFFNSASITSYQLYDLSAWTDADSLEQFVQAAEVVDGTSKTIELSYNTKNALTQAQKDRITGAGWTLQ